MTSKIIGNFASSEINTGTGNENISKENIEIPIFRKFVVRNGNDRNIFFDMKSMKFFYGNNRIKRDAILFPDEVPPREEEETVPDKPFIVNPKVICSGRCQHVNERGDCFTSIKCLEGQ